MPVRPVANAAFQLGLRHAMCGLVVGEWPKTLVFIVLAPLLGLVLAYALMIAVYWLFRKSTPSRMDSHFRRLQLVSAAAYSFAHGTNDAQKTMGIITGVLVASVFQKGFHVPIWVVLSAHAAIALGTLSGGWHVIRTDGNAAYSSLETPRRLSAPKPLLRFRLLFAMYLKQPVSTTHVIAGSIAGVGSIQRFRAVRWSLARNIVWAWVLTIPMSAAIAMLAFLAIHTLLSL